MKALLELTQATDRLLRQSVFLQDIIAAEVLPAGMKCLAVEIQRKGPGSKVGLKENTGEKIVIKRIF